MLSLTRAVFCAEQNITPRQKYPATQKTLIFFNNIFRSVFNNTQKYFFGPFNFGFLAQLELKNQHQIVN
jgi:hypothetical protein